MKPKDSTVVGATKALSYIADGLDSIVPIRVGSLWEFVKDVWSKSYTHPEYFNSWHIGLICEDVELAMQQKQNYCCVMPRLHLKSTVLGHAFSVWNFLRTAHSGSSDALYLSYSDGMAVIHIKEINKHVRRNEQIMEWLKDRSPEADYSFRYYINSVPVEIMHGGLFSFKRGMHVNRHMIVDDILRDPENPLNTSQMTKIETFFDDETMYIPTKEAITIVMGTPMLPDDLLAKLRDDERFNYRFLPALDPIPGQKVLMPMLFGLDWLLREQKAKPDTFQKEFMLAPALTSEMYFTDDEIRSVENSHLQSLDPYKKHTLDSEYTVAGFDVGKKRHPSHLAIFTYKSGKVTQVHQSFLDGWPYTKQVKYLNEVIDNFNIDRGYVDNTRGELEERGLKDRWKALVFTFKKKREMAQIMEQFVNGDDKLELIPNDRQRIQITCVDNELKAPATPLGHGDAFWSIGLALKALHEHITSGTRDVGNIQDLFSRDSIIMGQLPGRPTVFIPEANEEVCPQCGESRGWLVENQKCLFCHAEKVFSVRN